MDSKKVKPFNGQSENFTLLNNYILDYIMPQTSPNGWKCLCFILRKTKGWQKESDSISFSQIKEGTGIKSDPTVSKALKELEDSKFILVVRSQETWESNTYSLNIKLEIEVKDHKDATIETIVEDKPTIETIADATIENIVGSTIETIDTKETKKEIKKEGDKSPPPADKPKTMLMGCFQSATGLKMPHKKSDVGFWWSNIAEIYHIVDEDVGRGQQLIRNVVTSMRRDGLTISGPQSIVNPLRAEAAKPHANGNHGPKLTPEQLEAIKRIEAMQ